MLQDLLRGMQCWHRACLFSFAGRNRCWWRCSAAPCAKRPAIEILQIMNPAQTIAIQAADACSNSWARLVVLSVIVGLLAAIVVPVHIR